jgi:arylsulfatase A-like enzyme
MVQLTINREKMRKLINMIVVFFLAAFTLHTYAQEVNPGQIRPNILIFISDDQGYGDFGFTGNKIVKTPNLDQLSEESAFYPHYLVGPACTPTRSALLTGRNHLDAGVWGVGSRGKVRRDEIMMPAFFTPSSYHTWAFGKMDGGLRMMEMNPGDRGFDFWFSPPGATVAYQHKLPGGWGVELITDAAIEKIRSAGDESWMMLMAYIIPHLPWHCPDSYADPYREKGYTEDLAQCYGSINQMDDQIGRLLNVLGDEGQAENTIVLFMSDNGPVDAVRNREVLVWENQENKRIHTEDWKLRNPDELVGRKGEVWDNGIRSPLLVRWPGKIEPGVRKQAIGVEDILPTLLDLAQISKTDWPEHLPFAGRSFRSSLEDMTFSDDRDFFRLASGGPGTPVGNSGIIPDAAELNYSQLHTILQSGKYKFHHLPGDKLRLYDMGVDPRERKDLSEALPERTREMAKRCRAQWDEIAKRNRTFPMRQLLINNSDKPRGSWRLSATQALYFNGEMKSVDFGRGLIGFRSPGDLAGYEIEVQKALSVSVLVEGKNLDKCATIDLLVNGKTIEVLNREAEKIEFGLADLPAGKVPFELFVSEDAKKGTNMGEITRVTLKLIQ